jgi:hypothetical protein
VTETASTYFIGNVQLLRKLRTAGASLRDNANIVVPTATELVNVIGKMVGGLPLTKNPGLGQPVAGQDVGPSARAQAGYPAARRETGR